MTAEPTLESIEAALAAARLGALEIRLRKHRDLIEVQQPFEIKLGNLDDANERQAHLIANAPSWLSWLVRRVKAAEAERDAAKAETWDEGYAAGVIDYRNGKWYPTDRGAETWPDRKRLTLNPYRAPASDGGDL